ncbi:MAG TPA: hypothetical protein VKU02_23730 [Gemmataceae bacterium]|nr:hypothetical protein [Gemmataceae bacterium]
MQGKSGAQILQTSAQYYAHTGSSATVYPVASTTRYRNTDGTGGKTTSSTYTWFTGTTQVQALVTTMPVIASATTVPASPTWTPLFTTPVAGSSGPATTSLPPLSG